MTTKVAMQMPRISTISSILDDEGDARRRRRITLMYTYRNVALQPDEPVVYLRMKRSEAQRCLGSMFVYSGYPRKATRWGTPSQSKSRDWEAMVPPEVAAAIKQRRSFGYGQEKRVACTKENGAAPRGTAPCVGSERSVIRRLQAPRGRAAAASANTRRLRRDPTAPSSCRASTA